MKLCRFNTDRVGIVEGNEVVDVSPILDHLRIGQWPFPPGDLLIAQLPELRPRIEELAKNGTRHALSSVRLLSPVANPGKIIGAPVNYKLHFDEAEKDDGISFGAGVKRIEQVGLFLKATSSLAGVDEGVRLPRTERRIDHEIELGLVIGKAGSAISEDDALDHVAGYAIALDMTIRGPEERSMRKSLDTFSVLGPWLVTADEFGDPSAIDFELQISGETKQKANTRDLIFDCRKLIAYASSHYTLHPGDIIMTGTPEGVGPVQGGDVMECWIDRIGAMSVPVIQQ